MPRRSTKKFEYGKGIYYFVVGNNNITIKRTDKKKALESFRSYSKSYKNCEWLGKWDGGKFIENNAEKVNK